MARKNGSTTEMQSSAQSAVNGSLIGVHASQLGHRPQRLGLRLGLVTGSNDPGIEPAELDALRLLGGERVLIGWLLGTPAASPECATASAPTSATGAVENVGN
jgi:hypothetical protein